MKARRKSLKLSQSMLAEKIGTSGNYIAQIERGEKFPSPAMLERIAEALNIDSTELFTRSTENISNPWDWCEKK